MKINFVGDLILGDQPVKFGYGFDSIHSKNAYCSILDGVGELLNDADYNVANFESIIKLRSQNDNVSNWSMACDKEIAERLKESHIGIVNVANNHTMDYGVENFNLSVNTLKNNGIQIIGLKEKPYICIKKNDEAIVIVGVSYLKVKGSDEGYFACPSENEWEKVCTDIAQEHPGAKKICFVHWGSEFISHPSSRQVEILDELVRYGFCAIIGHHPHVLQDFCSYKNVPVFFSLGNFISDYWQERARKTVVLQVETNDISCHFHKIRHKFSYFKWVVSRLIYLAKFGKQENSNPEIVYEKYKR